MLMNIKEKKGYKKPEIREVHLAPEEAVLSACRKAGTLRSQGSKCDNGLGACINRTQGT